MNIAMVSTHDKSGGAAIAAHRLYKGLKHLNHNVAMMVRYKRSNDPSIYKAADGTAPSNIEKMIFQSIQEEIVMKNRTELSNTWFSIPYPGYELSKTQVIANSQVINLHWVAEFQSVETISDLINLGKPVVWTLHDENPYTGGCHYTAGCTGYQTDCRNCPQLQDTIFQFPFYILENKIKLWKENLTLVTPSKWLAECAKKSRVFKKFRVEVIPNSLETDIFKPKAKNLAKKEIGLPPQAITFLFGAHSGNEKRKGFDRLLKAMKYCLQDDRFKNLVKNGGIRILTFGPPQGELEEFSIQIDSMGYVNDNNKLSTIYSAADIFVLPSLEDNLPNTMLEAMACGTPVLGFEVGGLPDMIQQGVTGFMAPGFDCKKFGELILTLVFNEHTRSQMALNCRELIEKKFKLQDQAENYLELFKELLEKKKMISKGKEHNESVSKNENVILNKGEPMVQPGYFNLYRAEALTLKDKKEQQIPGQLSQLNEKDVQLLKTCQLLLPKDQQILLLLDQLREKEAKIQKIYKSYSYRIGHLFLYPLKLLKKISWKIYHRR